MNTCDILALVKHWEVVVVDEDLTGSDKDKRAARAGAPGLTGATVPIYSADVLVPLIGWHPGQLPSLNPALRLIQGANIASCSETLNERLIM